MVKIEIFGLGCENCERLESRVKAAVEQLGIDANIEKIEDFETFVRRGITATPGLAVDENIFSLGRVPSVDEIIGMLRKKSTSVPIPSGLGIPVVNPTCGCSTTGTMIYPCSGGSNVGQISNEAAKAMVVRGLGKFSCLAGVGAHGEVFIASAKKAGRIVVIDGCATRCAYKMLKHVGIEPTVGVVVTDLGIEKDYERLDPSPEDVRKTINLLEEKLDQN
ncbi:MAG: TM0996/MTH895 family glutaredoxin-like protein [Methanomassiliicoccus sp.]|nr:TM0996/MTH895 family glutaredoxin-like protein [Methanomassiliicoccus sp.]